MSDTNGLNRRMFHIYDEQMEQLAEMADENISRAAHVRIAIKEYLERASRRQRRATASS